MTRAFLRFKEKVHDSDTVSIIIYFCMRRRMTSPQFIVDFDLNASLSHRKCLTNFSQRHYFPKQSIPKSKVLSSQKRSRKSSNTNSLSIFEKKKKINFPAITIQSSLVIYVVYDFHSSRKFGARVARNTETINLLVYIMHTNVSEHKSSQAIA